MALLHAVPSIRIGHRFVLREQLAVGEDWGLEWIRPREHGQAVAASHLRDLRQAEFMVLHVEQQIATLAHREEIPVAQQAAQGRSLALREDLLTKRPDGRPSRG